MAARAAEVNLDSRLCRAKESGMEEDRIAPADCSTMEEVRHGVDRLDERIVALLAERFRYMEAAARIKTERAAVRDEWRKADVLFKVKAVAEQEAAPTQRIADFYEALIESSITHEFAKWDAMKQ